VAQLPLLLHVAGSVAVPFVQLALRQATEEPTKPAHVARCVPSQVAAEHGLPLVAPEHAARAPWGSPEIGTHVPSPPLTSHASHCPAHGALQQNPSTQSKPDAQASGCEHADPCGSCGVHVPFLQYAPAPHCVVLVHPPGHAELTPSHDDGAQLGEPAYPAGATVHVPSAVAPRALAHTSQDDSHVALQQKPSWQAPDAQTAQPATRQSTPAVSLQDAPCTLRGTHEPVLSQKFPALQPLSLVHVAGHVGDAPSQTYAPHPGLPAYPLNAGEHVPSADAPRDCAHTSHGPAHAAPQQTPSAQMPFAQSAFPPGQGCPCTPLQAPVASHVLPFNAGAQVSGSATPMTAEQMPGVARLQAWHGPQLGASQQTLSTQYPVSHWALVVHPPPRR
jgi:hypothetical protein